MKTLPRWGTDSRSNSLFYLVLTSLVWFGSLTNAADPKTLVFRLRACGNSALPDSLDQRNQNAGVAVGQTVEVEIGDRPRKDVPVSMELSLAREAEGELPRGLRLVETTGGQESLVASQIEAGTPPRLWWILKGETPARTKRTFRIMQGEAENSSGITVDRHPDYLEMRRGDSPILRYNTAHLKPPAGLNPKYGRSGFIHPVWTPSGAIVTEQFPADHAHQSGLFLAYVKTEFEGRSPDFWNLAGGTGRVRFKAVHSTTSGPVYGEVNVEHEHVDLSGAEAKVVLNETWQIRVWNVGGKQSGYSICDIVSHLTCATASPLKLSKYHYGGMALRGSGSWGEGRGRFLTSDGKDRNTGNHSRPHWCDLSGLVGDRTAGLAIMTHPRNFGFPEPLRIHPTMPYMVYTPSQLGEWEIVPAKPHVSRYRFLIHDDDLTSPSIDRIWLDFSESLVAQVRSEEKNLEPLRK